MKDTLRGTVAGFAGVATMAGIITSLRRALLSNEELAGARWHPEKVVEALAALVESGELDDRTRRRLGDLLHYRYGAAWGAVLAATTRGEPLDPVRHGAGLALGLWTLGFGAVLPAVGAHPPFGTWRKRREFVLPLSARLAYGVGTVTVLKGLRSD